MPSLSPRDLLHQAWVHSHEEDTATEMVFRPVNYAFPPSRGRTGYTFRADGTCVQFGPGPADRQISTAGTWSIDPDYTIRIVTAGPPQLLYVVTLGKDKLTVKR